MIITIKNLQQQTFTVEFEPEKSVLELKAEICEQRGYSVEKQKLIYAGIILEDDRKVSSYNIDEKKFVVVMVQRDVANSGPKKTAETEGEKQKSEQNPQGSCEDLSKESTDTPNKAKDAERPESKREEKTSETNPISTSRAEASSPAVSQSAESHLLMGEEYLRTVDSMVEMGYSRETVERAMAASFNNPERAVEYLISGIIPESGDVDPLQQNPQERNESHGELSASQEDPFEFLRDQPQFLQMRSLIYENPDLLHAVLQQIGQTNPALLQLISENQDAFLNMLNQPIDGHNSGQRNITAERRMQLSDATRAASASLVGGSSGAEGESVNASNNERSRTTAGSNPSNENRGPGRTEGEDSATPIAIRLTPQEKEAVERLKAMGFPEALVLQAYFACEKDEQLAANFLISSSFDD